jgi:peptide/nickel transport system ATP-binding protein
MTDVLLQVNNLKKYFVKKKRFGVPVSVLHAVDDVSFTLERGKTLGIVGESGCGKTTIGRTILRLIEPTSGEIIFEGQGITKLNTRQMREMRKNMQIIFQDPYSSIDPRKTVNQIISEPLLVNKMFSSKAELEKRVAELMEAVGLAERLFNAFPHELDGGRRQRIGVARALALRPKLIVCDEPVSALDVSIQAQILNLLMELQERMGLTYIFISHDLSVVKHISDEIAVMYLGKLVEKAPSEELFENPLHPYTQALISAIPTPDLVKRGERIILKGEISSPINPKDECRFIKRCNYACDECRKSKTPELKEVSPGHFVACYKVTGCANKE